MSRESYARSLLIEGLKLDQQALSMSLTKFCNSRDFEAAVIAASKVAPSGESVFVELFPDGWRMVYGSEIGNKAVPRVLLRIPAVNFEPDELETWLADGGSEKEFFQWCFHQEKMDLISEMRSINLV